MNAQIIYKGRYSEAHVVLLKSLEVVPPQKAATDVLIIVSQGTLQIEHSGLVNVVYPGEHLLLKAAETYHVKSFTNAAFYLIKLAPANDGR
jgi:hypothetical protein